MRDPAPRVVARITSFVLLSIFAVPVFSQPTCGGSQVTFSANGVIQQFQVPPGVTSLTIDAAGAQGGAATSTDFGGKGARLVATFSVSPGEVLNVIVGGMGSSNQGDAGGGGGASLVYRAPTAAGLLLAAAGGGGSVSGTAGIDGSDSAAASAGQTDGVCSPGLAGTGGSGGGGGCNTGAGGGGGAGLLSNGGDGFSVGSGGGDPSNGAAGGLDGTAISGGFGGGGAATDAGGGGGGGYNGGGGGGSEVGGGGGSFVNGGTTLFHQPGAQTGDGHLSLCFVEPVAAVPTLSLGGLIAAALLILSAAILRIGQRHKVGGSAGASD
jgi:hypothetical protein